jgi:hypothetical protein
MQENQDKKISYKILIAEELLKEETLPAKEIEHKEEKIEVPAAQKIEIPGEVLAKKEEVKEEREVIKPELKIEAGLIYPSVTKEEEIVKEGTTELEVKTEIPTKKAVEDLLPHIQPEIIKEEPSKEEIFYTPKKEKEAPFRPKPELLQKEVERKETPEPFSSLGEARREFKLPPNLLRFVFLGGGVILIFLLILFLKPQEKFKAIFKAKEEKKEEIKIATQTETVILFPTNVPTILPVTTISTPTQPEATTPTVTLKIQPAPFQTETKPTKEISFLANYSSKEIYLKNLDFSNWQEEFKKFLSLQEFSGSKIKANFLYNKNKIPFDFLFSYFIKPTKISSEKIEESKNNFTGSYGLLIYYGYTRKYPILIFEIKDKEKVLKFNQEWEKTTMREDLKTLFLGLEPPKIKNNFVTKKQGNYSYRILDFGDNFKIIWTLADNYLIYSATETGLKDIFNLLK